MDRNERIENPQIALLEALAGERADIWTTLPGIVQSFDASKRTVVVQTTVRARVAAQGYSSKTAVADPGKQFVWDQLPVLVDCPVVFPSGGGFVLTFPIAKGDECLVHFSARCIDAWWTYGGIQNQPIVRMHDLSDGFAQVGVRSLPNVEGAISTNTVQLRSVDGVCKVEMAGGHVVNITAPGGINLNGLIIDTSGNLSTLGTLSGSDVIFGGKSAGTHTHPQSGGGNTGAPN